MRSYQTKAAIETLDQVLTGKYIAGVIGATPGAGKTTISFIFINEFVQKFPNSRILVLTHNTLVLKNQYLSDLSNSHVQLNFTFGDFQTDAQVRVGIPASIKTLDWGRIDLLIVDEAHEFWAEKMVNSIYKELNPSYVVLLTGSPSAFTMHNKAVDQKYKGHKKYYIYYISGSDLAQNDVFSSVSLDSVQATGTTAENLVEVFNRVKTQGYDTSKIMIACSDIEQAGIVAYTMKERGRKVALSTSNNDKDSNEFKAFISGQKDVLIVVRRGVLGFSDVNLTLLIDMKCSQDLNVRFQLFSRVLRKSPKGTCKAYLTVPSNNKMNGEIEMLEKLIEMMDRDLFVGYAD